MIDRGKEIDSRVSIDRNAFSSVSCKTESASPVTRFIERELKLLESRIITPPEIMADPNSSNQTRFGFPSDSENPEEFSHPSFDSQKLLSHYFDRYHFLR
jgi:hypothetical protein